MRDKVTQITDEIYLLCILHNVGAIHPERALSIEEISCLASMEKQKVEENLNRLIEKGYAETKTGGETKKYFVTINGMRKVLSIYS
ncbi:MAG: winged helix DNA-binding protein [Candidatus Bathyarchaeia archaeon]